MISLDSAMKLAARAVMCKDWAGRFCVLRRTVFFQSIKERNIDDCGLIVIAAREQLSLYRSPCRLYHNHIPNVRRVRRSWP